MRMILQASAVAFVLIGAFQPASCVKSGKAETKLHVPAQIVYVAFQETLELNCSFENVSKELVSSDHILWKHNNSRIQNFTHRVNNNTLQLRRKPVSFEDAGVYECTPILNSSQYAEYKPRIVTVVVGVKPPKPEQPRIEVFGMPPQNVTITRTARHANWTNEVRIGVWKNRCVYKFSLCNQRPSSAYEVLSCSVGKSVLEELFPTKHSTHDTKTNASDFRADVFCAMVKVSNTFGSNSNERLSNLYHETRCPAPRDFRVAIGDHDLLVNWFRPRLVLPSYPLDYHLEYRTKSLLGLPSQQIVGADYEDNAFEEDVLIERQINSTLEPYTKYEFRLSCSFFPGKLGPEARTEVTTREAAPSEAPFIESCEMKRGSPKSCDGHVSLAWKRPPKNTWNGLPRKFMSHYWQEKGPTNSSYNESLVEFNGSATEGVLKDVNACKNGTIRLSMCTNGGCGPLSRPCHIKVMNGAPTDDHTNDHSSPEGNENNNLNFWIAVALGISAGLVLAFVLIGSMHRKRLRKTRQRRLSDLVGPLNISPHYENEFDDRPSVCEVSQDYDEVIICDSRPLLKEISCSIGRIPVTRI